MGIFVFIFPSNTFYSDIGNLSGNKAGFQFYSNICEYGALEESALFSFVH
jgi:hypothetical protein